MEANSGIQRHRIGKSEQRVQNPSVADAREQPGFASPSGRLGNVACQYSKKLRVLQKSVREEQECRSEAAPKCLDVFPFDPLGSVRNHAPVPLIADVG